MDGTDGKSAGPWTLRLAIDGVDGAGKAAMVEAVVEALPGVRWARVDYALAHIDIRGQGPIDEDELVAAVAGTGCSLRAMDGGDAPQTDVHAEPDDHGEPVVDDHDRVPDDTEDPASAAERSRPDDKASDEGAPSLSDIFGIGPANRGEDEAEPAAAAKSHLNVFGLFGHVALWCVAVSLVWAIAYRFLPVPMTIPMFGDALFGNGVRNQWVPLARISPNLIRSVIASEDNEFCHHHGFDFEEIHDALREAQNGGRARGASTISQQTAKNAFLWTDHSYLRKALEAYLTVVIEVLWPKRRIMEVYLNIAEWGDGIYGAEAAARHWFRKPASRLSALEAARLAAILPAPDRWKANPAGPYVLSRSYTIMARANSVDLNGDDRCARP